MLIFSSCAEDDILDDAQTQLQESTELNVDPYAEGTQFDNPYTVDNMRTALDSLKAKVERGEYKYRSFSTQRSSNDFLENFTIETSHKYVKLTPQDEDEYANLKRDSTLILFDYPLDYNFLDSFFDSRENADGSEVVDYYTTVLLSRSLPSGVARQDLADIYVPEEDPRFNELDVQPITREANIFNLEDFLHHLLLEAYTNTGNLQEIQDGIIDDPSGGQRVLIFGRRWTPSGRIRVWDENVVTTTTTIDDNCTTVIIGYDNTPCLNGDTLNCPLVIYGEECNPVTTTNTTNGRFVPVVGAQVLMRQFFTVAQGITDADGNFTTGRIRGRARYVVQWERYHYSIRRGLVFQAHMRGPRLSRGAWFRDIRPEDTRDTYPTFAHLGAHRYYYGNRLGTTNPPLNGAGKRQMKIAAMQVDGSSSHIPFFSAISGGAIAQIHLKAWQEPTDEIYGTMIHELAHAAHRNYDFIGYNSLVARGYTIPCATGAGCGDPSNTDHQTARRVMETWAQTAETEFTLERYRNEFNTPGYNYILNRVY